MKTIQTIFFDLFNVLIGVDQSVVVNYVSKLTDTPYLLTKDIIQGEIFMRYERGEIDFKQYFIDIQYALNSGEKLDFDEFKIRWVSTEIGEMPATNLITELNGKTNIWLLSNTTNRHIKYLKSKFGFFENVNGVITSQDAGVLKPDPQIYRFALHIAHCLPENALYVDDQWTNVQSAKSAGITSHHYTDFEKLQKFLKHNLS
ncbi:MAG: HAD-IA family hydrolase [Candidatus Marinimicrobia bacterium]|nr:HAD-IA family hydrolase [Candidatus Neomarinimicrobiota bacterium]MBL7022514.1 HAD-IA family hydrolase [Candidatus Neomarinimicrobiota bacterium]MBL7108631.1 HAD-IA family hydrolase [Candidatus Neomarinimicrobiota bacterium]